MRWKIEGDDQNHYKCCFCCHVRTGTIFLGLFHLGVHILVLSMFAVMVLHPELVHENQVLPGGPAEGPGLDNNYSIANFQWLQNRPWSSEEKFIFLLVTMGSFFLAVSLVYGAVKGLPGYLIPFFSIQVFDFCITCLTIVGCFSYLPDIKKWIDLQPDVPYRDYLMAMDGDLLMLLAVMFFILILTIKAYFLGVVWACYSYLTNCNKTTTTVLRAYDASNGEDSEMLLPPKYEDAIRMEVDMPPPPPYCAN